MTADSLPRRLVKKYLVPLVGERTRETLQAIAVAKDILDGSQVKTTEPEASWLHSWVKPGETVLDIGANFGLYTYHASKAVGRAGRVIAFEPVPSTRSTLRKVCGMFRLKNVTIVPKGCSDKAGVTAFSLPLQSNGTPNAGLAFISISDAEHSSRRDQSVWEETSTIEAEVVRIDDFLPEIEKLSLVKVDIEGADLLALRGARQTLEEHRPAVIMEVEPRWYETYGISARDIAGFFSSLEYTTWKVTGGGLKLVAASSEQFDGNNRIFLPREAVHGKRK